MPLVKSPTPMRLGQFARKYDLRVQDLISHLEGNSADTLHSNTKLSEETEADILDFFGLEALPELTTEESLNETENSEDQKDSPSEQEIVVDSQDSGNLTKDAEWDAEDSGFIGEGDNSLTPLEEIAAVEGEIVNSEEVFAEHQPPDGLEETQEKVEGSDLEDSKPADDEVIQTDKLLEILESEESYADLDKIKLIKAPKRELSGLKVLGKVDLPEPKKKPEPEEKSSERTENKRRKNQRPQLSEEEKEKRRLKAKRKKEAFEARQAKREKEQEAKKEKARRAAHYQQQLEQQKTASKKRKLETKQKLEAAQHKPEVRPEEPKPKTMLGKLWKWLNT